MTGYFVTGTDTGVGKTYVTAAMARLARSSGKRVFAFKPVETGCSVADGERRGEDQDTLTEAAGSWQTGDLRGLYRLLRPAAPHVAARDEGVVIDLGLIARTVERGAAQADVVLVEGAGGWRVPVTAEHDMAALACELGFPVIIVARATLGTLNHTLLTIEAVERDGCSLAAVVMSRRPDDDLELASSNREQLLERWRGPVVLLDRDPHVLDMFHVEHFQRVTPPRSRR
jgi:dethiobiotin synthetase